MRTCSVICAILIVFPFILSQTEAFTKVSVPTALAIIATAAKIKAIWLKTYLGLRSMGFFRNYSLPMAYIGPPLHHYPRYRRSLTASELFIDEQLLSAWQQLESVSGRKLNFDERSCFAASKSNALQKLSTWRKLLSSETILRLNNQEYSSIVSALIGYMTRDPAACQFAKMATTTNSMQ